MVDAVMLPVRNANCLEDVDDFLLNITAKDSSSTSVRSVPTPEYATTVNELPQLVRDAVTFSPSDMSTQEQNVLAYICGYICRKLNCCVCSMCKQWVHGVNSKENCDPSVDFILLKRYADAKHGLIVPSSTLISIIIDLEIAYRNVVEKCIHCNDVKLTLVRYLLQCESLKQIQCVQCCIEHSFVHLFVNVRFHHTLKLGNDELAKSSKRQNRKTLKFSHL